MDARTANCCNLCVGGTATLPEKVHCVQHRNTGAFAFDALLYCNILLVARIGNGWGVRGICGKSRIATILGKNSYINAKE